MGRGGGLVKKFLSCTDSAAVEAQKIINKVAKETGFPCNSLCKKVREEGGGRRKVGTYLRGVLVSYYDGGVGAYLGEGTY